MPPASPVVMVCASPQGPLAALPARSSVMARVSHRPNSAAPPASSPAVVYVSQQGLSANRDLPSIKPSEKSTPLGASLPASCLVNISDLIAVHSDLKPAGSLRRPEARVSVTPLSVSTPLPTLNHVRTFRASTFSC